LYHQHEVEVKERLNDVRPRWRSDKQRIGNDCLVHVIRTSFGSAILETGGRLAPVFERGILETIRRLYVHSMEG